MGEYGGYVFVFDEGRRAVLLRERAAISWTFSDIVSDPDSGLGDAEVGLIMFANDEIAYAALVRRGSKVATAKVRIGFSHLVEMRPIPFEQLHQELPSNLRRYLARSPNGIGGRIRPRTWLGLI